MLRASVCVQFAQVVGDCPVVPGGQLKRLHGKAEIGALGNAPAGFLHLLQDGIVIRRIGYNSDKRIVLGRRPEHGRPPDVDVLDRRL